jgi:hypothetical protein
LEGDIAAVAYDFRADLDQLVLLLKHGRRVVLRNRSALNRINAESGMRGSAKDQTASKFSDCDAVRIRPV